MLNSRLSVRQLLYWLPDIASSLAPTSPPTHMHALAAARHRPAAAAAAAWAPFSTSSARFPAASNASALTASATSIFSSRLTPASTASFSSPACPTPAPSSAAPFVKSPHHIWHFEKHYRGPVKGVILDWAGTVLDCGVYAPAVVFIQVFEKEGVPISMEEARAPMGLHKKVHIRKITELPSVRARWQSKFNRMPTEADVERMFENFVPLQLACMREYTEMIPGAVSTVRELQKNRGLKIGATTGFTKEMTAILLEESAKAGYVPDSCVSADEVPAARPYPFMVWSNCLRLSLSPIAAVVKVDDTKDGIQEGLAAGCWTVGLAKTGNYMAKNLSELSQTPKAELEQKLSQCYDILAGSGAHFVIDDISSLPQVIDEINRRLARGERP